MRTHEALPPPRWVSRTLIGARDSPSAEGEREDGPSGPAVCLRAGSHEEMHNVLIGVSGDGRYLTRLINQHGVKKGQRPGWREADGE